MTDVGKYLSTSLQKLEKVQSEVGDVQFQLYEALAEDVPLASTEEGIRKAVLDMEDVQRIVGMIQVNLLKAMVENKKAMRGTAVKQAAVPEQPSTLLPSPPSPHTEPLPVTPPTSSPGHWDLSAWLGARGLKVTGTRPPTPLDAACDNVSSFLGDNFKDLQDFFWMLKRQALGGHHNLMELNGLDPLPLQNIREWGKMLHKEVFLREYREDYKHNRIIASIQNAPRVKALLTGEWLERYSLLVMLREAKTLGLPDLDIALGTKVMNAAKGEAEFDLLAHSHKGKMLWVECKSGEWRKHLDRYRWLNEDHLNLPEVQTALVITEDIDDNQKATAADTSGMNVLHVKDFPGWVRKALEG
jgi:hypothetical protein